MSAAGTLKAVLFDMDGLLVDSEPVWFEVEAELFARLAARRPWTLDDSRTVTGHALQVSAGALARRAGSSVPDSVVASWMVEGMADRLARGVPFKPGAVALLAHLRSAGVAVAVVSSSYRRLVDTVVGQLPAGLVATSVAGDEVRRGKPNPDPYLVALAALGVGAEHTVVIEDSAPGATAGAAAGCAVLVVPDVASLPSDHPWHVADSLVDVDAGVLAALLGGDRA